MWNYLWLYQYVGTLLSWAHCHGSAYKSTVDLKASAQCVLQKEGEIRLVFCYLQMPLQGRWELLGFCVGLCALSPVTESLVGIIFSSNSGSNDWCTEYWKTTPGKTRTGDLGQQAIQWVLGTSFLSFTAVQMPHLCIHRSHSVGFR